MARKKHHRRHHFEKGHEDGRGDKVYGPYKGSDQNGGRPIYVIKHPDGTTTSTNKARLDYERDHHETLDRDTDVDHKHGGGRQGKDEESNLQTMSHRKNVAKENKRRAKSRARTDKYER